MHKSLLHVFTCNPVKENLGGMRVRDLIHGFETITSNAKQSVLSSFLDKTPKRGLKKVDQLQRIRI